MQLFYVFTVLVYKSVTSLLSVQYSQYFCKPTLIALLLYWQGERSFCSDWGYVCKLVWFWLFFTYRFCRKVWKLWDCSTASPSAYLTSIQLNISYICIYQLYCEVIFLIKSTNWMLSDVFLQVTQFAQQPLVISADLLRPFSILDISGEK